jgi:hypothetical protein
MSKVTFDGPNKLIIIDAGVASIDVRTDVYSEWKRWISIGLNSSYVQALRTFGGDDTSIGQVAPQYFFLMNNWKVQIDGDVTAYVTVALNLYTEDGTSPFVLINGAQVSNKISDAPVVNTAIGGLSTEQHNQLMGLVNYDDSTLFSTLSQVPESVWTYVNRTLSEKVDADIKFVNGVLVGNIDDFKATETIVDLSSIESKLDIVQLDIDTLQTDVNNINFSEDVNIIKVNGISVNSINDFKADNVTVDLSTIPQDVWAYTTRDLTVPSGMTPEQELKLDNIQISIDEINTKSDKLTTIENLIMALPSMQQIREEFINVNFGNLLINEIDSTLSIWDKAGELIVKYELYDNNNNLNPSRVFRREVII